MYRRLAAGFLVLCCAWSMTPAAPLALDELLSVDELNAELQFQSKLIAAALKGDGEFDSRRAKIKQAASVIAIVAQALAEHTSDSPLKKNAPALREAAKELAEADSQEDATHDFEQVEAGIAGKLQAADAAEKQVAWDTLAEMHEYMEEMNERAALFRKQLRRPKDVAEDSRHAAIIALLALPTHADCHADDQKAWEGLSITLRDEMQQAAKAMKAKNTDAATKHFNTGMAVCKSCHEKYKD